MSRQKKRRPKIRPAPASPVPEHPRAPSAASNSLLPTWMSPYQASVASRMPPGTTLDLEQVSAPVQPGQITFTSGHVTRSAEVLIGAATGGTVTVRLLPR